MPSEYPYIAMAGEYYCGRQKILSLIWILLFKADRLSLNVLGIQRRHILALLKAVLRRPARTLTLPVSGHLCIPVNNGHKVFDFTRLTTTKVFSPGIDPSFISAEIDCAREASRLSFTPTLHEVDADTRWYAESFAPGGRGDKNARSDPYTLFKSSLCKNLAEIIQAKPLNIIPASRHLSDIRDTLGHLLGNSSFDDSLCAQVSQFIRQIADKVEDHGDSEICLSFTHGDFAFVNFIYGEKSITVIDWETARYRSLLHDMHNYYFTELYYERIPSLHRNELDLATEQLSQCLARDAMQSINTLTNNEDLYRRFYFLERIQMLMEREPSLNLRGVILRSIEMFNRFENPLSNTTNN